LPCWTQDHDPSPPRLSCDRRPRRPPQKAFEAYLRSGDDDALRGLELEGKALNTAVNGEGGYLVDPQTAESIQSVLASAASIRAIANVVTVEATSFDVLIDHRCGRGLGHRDRRVDRDRHAADRPHLDPAARAVGLPKASASGCWMTRLRHRGLAGGPDRRQVRPRRGRAFINGDGVDKPKGFLTHPKVADTGLELGQSRLCRDRRDGDFDDQPGGCDRRPRLCAGRAVPRQCELRDELEDRGCGAQDEGCRWPVPVVRRPGRG
jgi:predicted phage gp36 major capsid-like protein